MHKIRSILALFMISMAACHQQAALDECSRSFGLDTSQVQACTKGVDWAAERKKAGQSRSMAEADCQQQYSFVRMRDEGAPVGSALKECVCNDYRFNPGVQPSLDDASQSSGSFYLALLDEVWRSCSQPIAIDSLAGEMRKLLAAQVVSEEREAIEKVVFDMKTSVNNCHAACAHGVRGSWDRLPD